MLTVLAGLAASVVGLLNLTGCTSTEGISLMCYTNGTVATATHEVYVDANTKAPVLHVSAGQQFTLIANGYSGPNQPLITKVQILPAVNYGCVDPGVSEPIASTAPEPGYVVTTTSAPAGVQDLWSSTDTLGPVQGWCPESTFPPSFWTLTATATAINAKGAKVTTQTLTVQCP